MSKECYEFDSFSKSFAVKLMKGLDPIIYTHTALHNEKIQNSLNKLNTTIKQLKEITSDREKIMNKESYEYQAKLQREALNNCGFNHLIKEPDICNEKVADSKQVDGDHYKEMEVQPWIVMEAVLTRQEFIGYLKGCIVKYSMRQGKKDISPMDGKKCQHYIEKLNEVLGENA